MTWYEFKKAYRFRTADKCCENCKYGDVRFEGECRCEHPLLLGEFLTGDVISCVCDLWETDGEAEGDGKQCV